MGRFRAGRTRVHRRAFTNRQLFRYRCCGHCGIALRGGIGHLSISRSPAADFACERVPRLASCRRRTGAIPDAVAFGALGRARASVHARWYGARADGTSYANHYGLGPPGYRGALAGIRRSVARRRSNPAAIDPDAARDRAAADYHRRAGWFRSHDLRSWGGSDRGRQHRRLHANDDDRDRTGNQQGGFGTGAWARLHLDRDHPLQ
jgi:hypothetical protein